MIQLTTHPITYNGAILRPCVRIHQNPATVRIEWDIGEVAQIGALWRTLHDSAATEVITPVCDFFLREARYYGVRHPRASWSFSWGFVTLHKDQLTNFLTQFLPIWEGHLQQLLQAV